MTLQAWEICLNFYTFGDTMSIASALLEIRLHNEVITLHGEESEASSQLLRGVIVLCLAAPLNVHGVYLQITGRRRIGFHNRSVRTLIPSRSRGESTPIFNYKWPSFVSRGSGIFPSGTMLLAGNYEWPFELMMKGSMAESIEGLADTHISYTLKATVRRGKLSSALYAYKPLRIVRTFSPAALGLTGPATVEGVWSEKIEYQFCIPQRAVCFGTAVPVNMSFTSLLNGLKIKAIQCALLECQEFTTQGSDAENIIKRQRTVGLWGLNIMDRNCLGQHEFCSQGEYTLQIVLPLPRRLSKCLQDVDLYGIKVRHQVRVSIDLQNPDGHVSELWVTLPIMIFITPSLPVDSNGCANPITQSIPADDMAVHDPPPYGEHILDQPCAGIGLLLAGSRSCLDEDIHCDCHSVDHGILGPDRDEEGVRGYTGSSVHYLEEIERSNMGDPPSYSTVIRGSLPADFSCESEAEVPPRPSVSEQLAERRHLATGDQPAKKVKPAVLMEEW